MSLLKPRLLLSWFLVLSLVLTGCGGGGGSKAQVNPTPDSPTTKEPAPDSTDDGSADGGSTGDSSDGGSTGDLVEPATNEAILYYKRDDANYASWGLHLWNNASCAGVAQETEWAEPLLHEAISETYGAYYRIALTSSAECINFILHKGDEKDLGEDDKIWRPSDLRYRIFTLTNNTTLSSEPFGEQGPTIAVEPLGGALLADTVEVTLTASAGATYTVSLGTAQDEAVEPQAFTSGDKITVGADLAVGDSVTVCAEASDDSGASNDCQTYTKRTYAQLADPQSAAFCELPVHAGTVHASDAARRTAFNDLRIYQIMVESFVDGTAEHDYNTGYGASHHRGDLQGIIDSLDYIASLNVNAIWLTPVFNSNGSTKLDATGYFTEDYFDIDPKFGTKELARQMVDRAHELGLYVFFDGVFGHYKGTLPAESPCGRLPESAEPGRAAYPGSEAFFNEVATYWIKELGIDGWRLDQAYQVPVGSWPTIRASVEAISKARADVGMTWGTLGYMVAEIWDGATAIQNTGYGPAAEPALHSAFDFPTRYSLVQVLATQEHTDQSNASGQPASQLNSSLNHSASIYADHAIPNVMLTNHDLVRFGDLIQRAGLGGKETPSYWARHKAAFSFMAAYTGPITLYYGDEIGDELPGYVSNQDTVNGEVIYDDHSSRTSAKIAGVTGHVLTAEQQDLKAYVAELMALRDLHPALSTGSRRHITSDSTTYVDLKTAGDERILYVLNTATTGKTLQLTSGEVGVSGASLRDLQTNETISVNNGDYSIALDALQGRFLIVQ
jgi:glycosidase